GFGGFEDFFGGNRRSSSRSSRTRTRKKTGSDLKIKLSLTLKEAAEGTTKHIKIKRMEKCEACSGKGVEPGSSLKTCPVCNGNGKVRNVQRSMLGQVVNVQTCTNCDGTGKIPEKVCKKCSGSGRIKKPKDIKIDIPAGISTGHYKTIRGEGNIGERNGPRGNLIAFFEIKPHKYFVRKDDNLFIELHITPSEAALGKEVKVPTLKGKVKLNIPPGVQSHKLLRLKGKGLPHLNGSGRGDQYVRVVIDIPKNISEKQKKIYKELESMESKQFQNNNRFSKIKQ
ncbi:MAG: J domain-containing protein, partial [Candidatus Marinimicrobia bacterium]|nr:J domain-containing protein [Candidatus Neomarinimicrobiota bacterium]